MVCLPNERNGTQLAELFEYRQHAKIALTYSQYDVNDFHLILQLAQFSNSYTHTHLHIYHLSSYACTFEIEQFFKDIDRHLVALQIMI